MSAKIKLRRRRGALAILSAMSLANCAVGNVIDATWLGGTSSWQNAGMWSGGVAPNNAGAITYSALIPNGSVTALPPPIAINAINLGAPATLNIRTNITVTGEARVDGNCYIDGN